MGEYDGYLAGTNTDDVTLAQARGAVSAAFTNWTAQTGLQHSEVGSGGDILINFAAIDGAGDILAQAFGPTNGDITLDSAETWSVAATPPGGAEDLETTVLHELGHSLGLFHSGFGQATMFPFSPPADDRTLDVDDNAGISSLYPAWEQLSGGGRDVAVGADGSAWTTGSNAVGPGDFGIYKWTGSAWAVSDGGGVRIAVSHWGSPIVNSAGQIWRRNSSNPSVNGWTLLSGGGKDLGIGADGSVWLVGSNPVRRQ